MSNKENEYLKELKNNEEVVRRVDTAANLNAIILVLINKGLVEENEFQKLFEKSKEAIYKKILKDLTKEQKQQLEANKKFRELFGGVFLMSNIEEDIEKIKQLNNLLKFFRIHGWIPNLSREINTKECETLKKCLMQYSDEPENIKTGKAIETVLSMLKQKDKEIEHQKEKRNNQKQELAILNKKQKEMNKLINTVSSYKGMFKRQQKDQEKKDKLIDLMAEEIKERKYVFTNKTKKQIKQYFERKARDD